MRRSAPKRRRTPLTRASFIALLGAGALAPGCGTGDDERDPYKQIGSVLCAPVNVDVRDPNYEELLRLLEPAGYVLYSPSRSPAAFMEATARIRAEYKDRPFIAIDQEGGRVQRIGGPIHLPSQMAVGATGSDSLAYEFGRCVGQTVRDVGGDVAFSPVLDLWSADSFLGTRCLSDDPKRVARMAEQIARGINGAGVTPVLKHYPGYAGVHDPDVAAAGDAVGRDTLLRSATMYADVLRESRYPVIVANVRYRENADDVPGSLSAPVVESLRRMHDDLVLFSDALDMAVVQAYAPLQSAGTAALRAGVDCLMFSQAAGMAQAVSALVKDFETGRIARSDVARARRQVAAVRMHPPAAVERKAVDIMPTLAQIARSSVTLLGRRWRPHPVRAIELAYPAIIGSAPSLRTLEAACRRYGPVELQAFNGSRPLGEQPDHTVRIVYVNETTDHAALERAAQVAVGERTAVITSAAPAAYIARFSAPLVLTYGTEPAQLQAAVDVLLGSGSASGVLPVVLPREWRSQVHV